MTKPNGLKNIAIGIRSHQFAENELRLFNLLKSVFDEKQIYFILDNTNKKFIPNSGNTQVIEANFIANLFNPPSDWGWRCGDFFYYAFREAVSYEYYCLIESDVTFTAETAKKLFSHIQQNTADLMGFNISKAGEDWYWQKTIWPICRDVYKLAFPFTVLSAKAIDYLKNQRIYSSNKFNNKLMYPNDEAFVGSQIISSNLFSYLNLNSIPWIKLNKFSTTNVFPLHLCNKDNYIYHSALPDIYFTEKLSRIITKCRTPEQINSCLTFALGDSGPDFIGQIKITSNELIAKAITNWEENIYRKVP
jgi:hypothetical protein